MITKREVNLISQLLGVEQQKIKQIMKSGEYKEISEVAAVINKILKEKIDKKDYKGYYKFTKIMLNFAIHLIPIKLREITVYNVLINVKNSERKEEIYEKMKIEVSKN